MKFSTANDGRLLMQLREGLCFVPYCSIHNIDYDWDEERCPSCVRDEDFWGYGDRWEKCPSGKYHDWEYIKSHSMRSFFSCRKCKKETIEYDPDGCDAIQYRYHSGTNLNLPKMVVG